MASLARSTFSLSACNQPSARAFPNDERVRRRAARARLWLYSGQSSPASASRVWLCFVTARYAARAIALRVSTSTGTPSCSMRGAPSSDIDVRNTTSSPDTLGRRYYAAAITVSQRSLRDEEIRNALRAIQHVGSLFSRRDNWGR